jgi:hypothetical protein
LFQVLFNKFSKYLEVARTQFRLSILGIDVNHENLVLFDQIVDNPNATALAAPAPHPSDLSQTSRLWNEVASFRIGDKHGLEGRIGLIVDKLDNSGCENVSLIENHVCGYPYANGARMQGIFLGSNEATPVAPLFKSACAAALPLRYSSFW